MILKNCLIGTVLIFILASCSNNSTSDLTVPQVIGNVTYNENIKPIIDQNCIQCHADVPINGAPMPLTNFEAVSDAIRTRPLLEKISKADGEAGLMPLGGPRLPQSKIDLIARWKTLGLQR